MQALKSLALAALECFARQFMKVLLVATSEVAAAAEAVKFARLVRQDRPSGAGQSRVPVPKGKLARDSPISPQRTADQGAGRPVRPEATLINTPRVCCRAQVQDTYLLLILLFA